MLAGGEVWAWATATINRYAAIDRLIASRGIAFILIFRPPSISLRISRSRGGVIYCRL